MVQASTLTKDQNEILDLRDRVFELEEEIRQLKTGSAANEHLPFEWGITPCELILAMALARAPNGFLSHDRALQLVSDKDGASDKLVPVHIMKLRKKLKDRGVEVLSRWGYGYEMPATSREIVKAAIQS